MPNTTSFSLNGLNFYFQSDRAKINGSIPSQLVKFIQGAKHSLDVAIYDMKNPDVLKALKGMSKKVKLQILYDAAKPKKPKPGVDPKPPGTEAAIKAFGLTAFARSVNE